MLSADGESQALLITEHAQNGAMLKQTFDNQGFLKTVKMMNHCKSALAYLRKIGPYKKATTPVIVFFDFTDPDGRCSERLQQLVYGKHVPRVPVIVFTTRRSQRHLDDVRDPDGDAGHLAPLHLEQFLQRFRNLDRSKFLGAVRQLAVFGPIVVELPESFSGQVPDSERQTA